MKNYNAILELALRKGCETSSCFTDLLNSAEINSNNFLQIISFSSEANSKSATSTYTSKIIIKYNDDFEQLIIELTHELTNRITNDKAKKAILDVEQGLISVEDFAIEFSKQEIDGQINQIKVASEIGYRFKDDGDGLNELIENYGNDNTIELSQRLVYSHEHLEKYQNDGKALREKFLSKKN